MVLAFLAALLADCAHVSTPKSSGSQDNRNSAIPNHGKPGFAQPPKGEQEKLGTPDPKPDNDSIYEELHLSNQAALIQLEKRRARALRANYNILTEDSDYADALVDGGAHGNSFVFSTCDCHLPEIPTEAKTPVLECSSKIGHHSIYVTGPRDHRKQLQNFAD